MRPQPSDPFFLLSQGEIDLGRGALLIGQQANPILDVECYLAHLDQLADGFRHPQSRDCAVTVSALGAYLFDELGFRGNNEHYDELANSYLNEVLDRRLGIPITLSLVYIEVGKRLGLPLAGVNFPYHFLVRCDAGSETIYIDPFARGQRVGLAQLAERLPTTDGVKLQLAAHHLSAASPRDILARILRNIKRIHTGEHQIKDAIRCGEKISWLLQDEADNHRDLGFLYYRMHEYQKSLYSFEEYLRWAPSAQDADEIRQNIQVISSRLSMLN